MKILITGAKGFVGRNLALNLRNAGYNDIYEYDIDTSEDKLIKWTEDCDFVFNLAGVNRPKDNSEFMKGNFGFADRLLGLLKSNKNKCPVMNSSSVQAMLDNDYGKSKKAGENLMLEYGRETGAPVYVYRFPNLFGKWCRPNYNSVIATFCYNIANGLSIKVNDESTVLNLVYIDDLIEEMLCALDGKPNMAKDGFCYVDKVYQKTLGEIAELLYSFKEMRENKSVPDFSDEFATKLYATYLSYLPVTEFSYPLKMNVDNRGSFTEIIRTPERGQFSVNVAHPGITKGNHWHNTKNEKFLVVSGKGVIRFKQPFDDKIIEYYVSGEKLEVVDIPTGYTHNIENIGDTDLVTFMWSSECFNPAHPDTIFLPIERNK